MIIAFESVQKAYKKDSWYSIWNHLQRSDLITGLVGIQGQFILDKEFKFKELKKYDLLKEIE